MNNLWTAFLKLRIWLTSFLLCLSVTIQAGTMVIVADEWFPVNGKPGDERPGYMIEMTRTMLAKHNHQLVYQLMPWERSLAMVRNGVFDCVIGAYKSDAPDFVFPDAPFGLDDNAFFVLKGEPWRYNKDIEQLKQIKLGVMAGYSYDDGPIDAYIKENEGTVYLDVIYGNSALESSIKKLKDKRLGAVLESRNIFLAKLQEMGEKASEYEIAGFGTESEPMYLGCSPKKPTSQQFIDIVNQELPKLRASGELKKILDRYGLEDWEK